VRSTGQGRQLSETEQTRIVTVARDLDLVPGDRLHCLELIDCFDTDRRHVVGPLGVKIGRTPPADIVLLDSEVSRSHCFVAMKGNDLFVSDLGSTNGTYVDGVRIEGAVPLPVGSILQVGKRSLQHECRTRTEISQSDELDRELQRASAFIQALLPPPSRDPPIRTDWVHVPCARLGGDAFGYGQLADDAFVAYLIDVAGHGPGAAMLAVAVMSQLRQRTLPDCDMHSPAEVLTTLNRLYQMDEQAGLFFTIWYGVYDAGSRRLTYASAGQHPALLVPSDRSQAVSVGNRNLVIGAVPGMVYKEASIEVPPGAAIYLFSDGVFEITDRTGRQWNFADFEQLVLAPELDGVGETERLFHAIREAAAPGPLEDDFSLVVAKFD
jgi:serine phosphatase RsbU (regulator of sigma subunit)